MYLQTTNHLQMIFGRKTMSNELQNLYELKAQVSKLREFWDNREVDNNLDFMAKSKLSYVYDHIHHLEKFIHDSAIDLVEKELDSIIKSNPTYFEDGTTGADFVNAYCVDRKLPYKSIPPVRLEADVYDLLKYLD